MSNRRRRGSRNGVWLDKNKWWCQILASTSSHLKRGSVSVDVQGTDPWNVAVSLCTSVGSKVCKPYNVLGVMYVHTYVCFVWCKATAWLALANVSQRPNNNQFFEVPQRHPKRTTFLVLLQVSKTKSNFINCIFLHYSVLERVTKN